MLEDCGDDNYAYGYYYATWNKRRVFWLEDVEYKFVTGDDRICLTESRIGEQWVLYCIKDISQSRYCIEKRVEYLFWCDSEFDVSSFFQDWTPSLKTEVLIVGLLCEFWYRIRIHAELFPCHHVIPHDVIKQLKKAVNVGIYGKATDSSERWSLKLILAQIRLLPTTRFSHTIKANLPASSSVWSE